MNNFLDGKKSKMIILFIFILSILFPDLYSNQLQPLDTVKKELQISEKEKLIRGERLFYGLVYLDKKSMNCSGCHNTHFSDTLNWNPDASEISRKYSGKNTDDLGKVLLNPVGKKLAESHKNFNLTPEDIVQIKGFMDSFASQGLKQPKPVLTYFIISVVAVILFLFSFTDLLVTKKIRQKWIHLFILLVTGIFITWRLVIDALAIGRSEGYSPDQPVKFSHAVHAGQNGTDCLYCHSSAEYSKTAGIPSTNVCMNCHLLVRNGTRSGTFEINKVIDAYENNKTIDWIKVHNLADHVFFSHAQHVVVAKLKCQECHGEVEKMDRITQISDLSMGWCINCHRTRNVNFNGNKFYSEYKELTRKLKESQIDTVTVEMIGGTECMKCHY
jgi:hypothetical protein